MRALLRLAIAGFLLVFGSPQLVVAHQIATPENGSPKDATQSTAAGYTLVDAEGATLADFTVIDVEDPPDDLVAGFTPAEGARPVLVTVQVENTGDGPFEVRPDLVALQDADGYLWSSTTIQRAEGFTVPDFQRV